MSVSEWDSTISHGSSAFLEFISATVMHRNTFLQSCASNKILSVDMVNKNGMREVDEKQIISL